MYCQECGNKLSPNAKFCSVCGTAITGVKTQKPKEISKQPVLVTRPVFIPWVTVASVIPIQLFMTVWAGGFFGGFGMLGLKAIGVNLPAATTFVFSL
mgnify:FL=1